jgi:basic amino acid/polyamine antiporter, APA family
MNQGPDPISGKRLGALSEAQAGQVGSTIVNQNPNFEGLLNLGCVTFNNLPTSCFMSCRIVELAEIEPPENLSRSLRTVDVVLLTVGGVIGSGIFLTPGGVLSAAGNSPVLALSAWVIGGVLALFGALTYSELGARRPDAGGLYIFIRDGFGRGPAFLFGLAIFIAGGGGVIAALVVAFGDTMRDLFGLSVMAGKLLAIGATIGITILNLGTAHGTAMLQNLSTLLRVGVLAGFVAVVALTNVLVENVNANIATPPTASITIVVAALVAVLWTYEGWQSATYSVGEMDQPARVLPRGLIIGVLILGTLFVAVNIGCLYVLGTERMATSKQALADAFGVLGYDGLAIFVRVFVGFSVLAAAHATLFTNSRVLYAMAKDGVFLPQFAVVSKRSQVPARAIIGCSAVAVILTLFNGFGDLLNFVVVSNWFFYGIAAASLFVIRRIDGPAAPKFSVPFYPVIPALFVIASAVIVISSWISGPASSRYGLIITLIGWAGYAVWARTKTSHPKG